VSQVAWLLPIYDKIPALLWQYDRWMLWTLTGDGRKVPRTPKHPDRNCNPGVPSNWSSFEQIVNATQKLNGPGFALGPVDKGPTIAGIDCDHCRDPLSGVIEPWAWEVIRAIDSYTEISPSGTGVKLFVVGRLPEDSAQGKVYKLEIYDRKRYFCVTGHHLPGTPTTIESRESELRALYARQRSQDLVELARLFGLFRQDRKEWIDIACPWADEHSQEDALRDTALHLDKDGHVDGFHCFHGSHDGGKKGLPDVLRLFGLKGGHAGFRTNSNGNITPDSQENIALALDKLGCGLRWNDFSQKAYVTNGDKTLPFEDKNVVFLWLKIDEQFHFRPRKEFFFDVAGNIAWQHKYHPVRDYLAGLTWDGTPRIDTWLSAYGQAKDTRLTRAIATLVLLAAVRRVRHPGCKFDELLVLISDQGTNKSTFLRNLCPNPDWFSDDVPLNVDSKQIIELTANKWIIEVSDLQGYGKRQIDHLKASLSRQVDTARQAYGREPIDVPRQFILIGTTNKHHFLRDKTGNRRFWPVRVEQFDTEALARDRNQLWAEAAQREAACESIRLDPTLYQAAERAQLERAIDDPWTSILAAWLGLEADDRPAHVMPTPRMTRVLLKEPWDTLGVPTERQTEEFADRLAGCMQSLGYVKKRAKGLEGEEKKRTAWRWVFEHEEPQQAELDDAGV
jgi:hypothetical protein